MAGCSHPAMDYSQVLCGPVLKKEKLKEFFAYKGLFKHSGETLYKAYMESQE